VFNATVAGLDLAADRFDDLNMRFVNFVRRIGTHRKRRALAVATLAFIVLMITARPLPNTNSSSAAVAVAAQQTMGACRCSDLNDLFNRKGELDAARAQLAREYEIVRGLQHGNIAVRYDDSKDSHLLRSDIQRVIDELHDPAIKDRMKNMSFPFDCESSVQGYTNCLHEAAKAGEAIYQAYCETRRNTGVEVAAVATGKSWQELTSILTLLEVADKAYAAELKYIDNEIDRLKPLCKTKGWSGKVIITWIDKDSGSTPGTGPTPITRTFENEERRDITIHVFDGKAYGEVSAGRTDKKTAKGEGDAPCGKYRNVHVVVDTTDNTQIHGDFYHRAGFGVNIDTRGLLTLNLSINGGYGVGTETHEDHGRGDCNNPPSPHEGWSKFLDDETLAGLPPMSAHGKADPQATVLDGVDTPLTQQVMLGTHTRTVKVEWHLTRAK